MVSPLHSREAPADVLAAPYQLYPVHLPLFFLCPAFLFSIFPLSLFKYLIWEISRLVGGIRAAEDNDPLVR